MSPEKIIKLQTRDNLGKNNWPGAVGAIFIVLLAVMIVLYLSSGIDLAVISVTEAAAEFLGIDMENSAEETAGSFTLIPLFILITPIFTGFLRYIYLTVRDGSAAFAEVFYYFGKKYFRTLGVNLMLVLRNFWKVLLCFAPYYILYIITVTNTVEKESLAFFDIMCYFISYALLLGGIVLCFKLCVKHFLYLFLYVEDENMGINEMFARSSEYMEKFTESVCKLFFSLFPLVLSCILVIPCVFAVPYITATMSTSAKWILALQHNSGNKDE